MKAFRCSLLGSILLVQFLISATGFAKISREQAETIARQYIEGLSYWYEDGIHQSEPVTGYEEYQLRNSPMHLLRPEYFLGLKPIEPQDSTYEAYYVSAGKAISQEFGCSVRVWVSADDGNVLTEVNYKEVYWNGSVSHRFYHSSTNNRWRCKTYEPQDIPFP